MSDDIYKKTYSFSKKIINLYKGFVETEKEYIMSRQLLKSGTSIGANVTEAKYAQSRKDFLHKMRISLKEAAETEYWLSLLLDSDFIPRQTGENLIKECKEIIKILTAIINTTVKKTKTQ